MKERSFDEMIAYFNRRVADMDIGQDSKIKLIVMVAALGYKYEKSAQRWIPCSERLPDDNGRYLVTFHQTATDDDLGFDIDDTDVRKMYYGTESGWVIPKRFPSWINDAITSTVIAWMPLPEPYRGEPCATE